MSNIFKKIKQSKFFLEKKLFNLNFGWNCHIWSVALGLDDSKSEFDKLLDLNPQLDPKFLMGLELQVDRTNIWLTRGFCTIRSEFDPLPTLI